MGQEGLVVADRERQSKNYANGRERFEVTY